jgi:mannose-6-phosphate isomerase-like protein (cupin superfamily)
MIVDSSHVVPRTFSGLFGGRGEVESRLLQSATEGSQLKAFALNRLPPGASIGMHRHAGDEDCYYCLSGCGLVRDGSEEYPITAGVLQITRNGETQALRNTGTEDLVYLAVLIRAPSEGEMAL